MDADCLGISHAQSPSLCDRPVRRRYGRVRARSENRMTSMPLWPLASAAVIVTLLTILIRPGGRRYWVVASLVSALWLLLGLVACLARGYFESRQWLYAIMVSPLFGVLWAALVFMTPSLFGKLIAQKSISVGAFSGREETYLLDSNALSRRDMAGTWGALVVILVVAGGVLMARAERSSPTGWELEASFAETLPAGTVLYEAADPSDKEFTLTQPVQARVYRQKPYNEQTFNMVQLAEDAQVIYEVREGKETTLTIRSGRNFCVAPPAGGSQPAPTARALP